MNDKEKLNYINLKYFIPYFASADEETYKSAIFPEIEFMMNRNGTMIPVIADTISHLNTLKFTDEIITM